MGGQRLVDRGDPAVVDVQVRRSGGGHARGGNDHPEQPVIEQRDRAAVRRGHSAFGDLPAAAARPGRSRSPVRAPSQPLVDAYCQTRDRSAAGPVVASRPLGVEVEETRHLTKCVVKARTHAARVEVARVTHARVTHTRVVWRAWRAARARVEDTRVVVAAGV